MVQPATSFCWGSQAENAHDVDPGLIRKPLLFVGGAVHVPKSGLSPHLGVRHLINLNQNCAEHSQIPLRHFFLRVALRPTRRRVALTSSSDSSRSE